MSSNQSALKSGSTIGIVICYFGKLPWYFDYFIYSCVFNPSISFFIIADDTTYLNPFPENVKFIYQTLDEVSAIATQKMGFEINIKYGYKFCDFKPAYGFLFSDLLKGYDFWGYGDIDVIYGNIRNFMTEEILNSHDLISVRPDWIPGCFLLFRNTDKMNTLFTQSKDYKKVFTSDTHYCFDETNFEHDAFTEGKTFREIKSEIESMMHVVKKMEELNYVRPYFDLHIVEGIPGRIKWNRGTLTYKNQYEVLLYHLILFKKVTKPKKSVGVIPDVFNISTCRIYHKKHLNNGSEAF